MIEVYDCLGKVAFKEILEDVIEETGDEPVFRYAEAVTFDNKSCPIGNYSL